MQDTSTIRPILVGPPKRDEQPARGRWIPTVQAVALATLAVIAVFATLAFARGVLLPVFVAVLLQLTLSPAVRLLRRAGIPPAGGAALILAVIVGAGGYGAYRLYGPAMEWTRDLPRSLRTVESKLTELKQSVEDVSKATAEVQNMTKVEAPREDNVVKIEPPSAAESFLSDAREFGISLLLAIVLLYFLLARQNALLRKLVRLLPGFTGKKRGVVAFRTVQRQLSRYLTTIVSINLVLGLVVAGLMQLAGMPNPLLWGAMAGTLNFVPYLGSIVGVTIVLFAGLLTFDTTGQAVAPAALYAVATSLEGMLVTPLVLGYRLQLSPAAIFAWLLLWSALWGFPGAIIAVPLLAAIKITCDNVPALGPVGRLLAR